MKNIFFGLLALLSFSLGAKSQSTTDSIAAKYSLLPMPQPLTIEKTFPVLGNYELNANGTVQNVSISLDAENKGIIWVEGLEAGKFKAYLKGSPAIYRIISQKTQTGKQLPEGTLIFDPATSALNIAIGKRFDSADPASVFLMNGSGDPATAGATEVKVKSKSAASKSKTKLQFYSAVKVEQASTASTTATVETEVRTQQ